MVDDTYEIRLLLVGSEPSAQATQAFRRGKFRMMRGRP